MKVEANKLLVSTIKKLLHRHAIPQLHKIITRSHPADLAHAFDFLAQAERRVFFDAISDRQKAADLLTEIEPQSLKDFLPVLEDEALSELLELMADDDTADVLAKVEDEVRAERLLAMMRREGLATAQSLLGYDPESAGGLMVPDFFALPESTCAADAIASLQEDAGRTEMVFYVYVINEHGHLVGVSSLRELVLARPQMLLCDFMIPEVIRVQVDTDQEEVARLIARYNLVALPVVDETNRLVGVITVDDIIDVIRREATEDMMLMAGASDQSVNEYGDLPSAIRARFPWLVPSMLGGFAATLAMWTFEDNIARLAPLVVFIPVIMSMGGNISNQSAAIVTRGLALRRTDFSALGRVVASELSFGLVAGATYGLLLSLGAWLLYGDHALIAPIGAWRYALTVGGSLSLSLSFAATLGALIPMLFSRLNLDPALATGPVVIPVVDTMGVWLFFSLSNALLFM